MAAGRTYHAQVLPDTFTSPVTGATTAFYSLDEGKTRFYDLMQLVEFYQLNQGTLNTRLSHYVIKKEPEEEEEAEETEAAGKAPSEMDEGDGAGRARKASSASSPGSRRSSNSSGCEVSMDSSSQRGGEGPPAKATAHRSSVSCSSSTASVEPMALSNGASSSSKDCEKSKRDSNHNEAATVAAAVAENLDGGSDAPMASEGDSDSMREFHQG